MGKRRTAREFALQILFQQEFSDLDTEEALRRFWQDKSPFSDVLEYTEWLVSGIISRLEAIDEVVQAYSENWRISRMAVVDRNILRLAAFEMLHEEHIAPAVIINEALEIAKKFSSDKGALFINGILDAVGRNIDRLRKEMKERNNDGREGQRSEEGHDPS
ncbi:MAG: transcription antitermination factor NusB [Candidatus Aminicenantes bacterium]|nr:transcription antitermination factor NusB [Candidatus Aminicenantes bacterium]